MSNVSATSARTPDNQVLRLVAGLLIGFSLGVDVTGWFRKQLFGFVRLRCTLRSFLSLSLPGGKNGRARRLPTQIFKSRQSITASVASTI